MVYYTKSDAIELIVLASKDIGLGDIDDLLINSIRFYLEDHIMDTNDISAYNILELGGDMCDHFSVSKVLQKRLDFQLAEILDVNLIFHFYFNGFSIEEY